MNGNTALDIVMDRLVRTDSSLRPKLLREMNHLIHTRLEQGPFVPWFLMETNTSMGTVASQEYVALPSGFLRFDDDMEAGGIWLQDTSVTTVDQWRRLGREQFNVMQDWYREEDSGQPKEYDLMQARVYFRPIPDDVYNLKLVGYFADDDVADAASTTAWLTNAADLVIADTCIVGASLYTRDFDLVPALTAERQVSYNRLLAQHTAWHEQMHERIAEG